MTSYLATLAARELGNDGAIQSPVLEGRPGAVVPRQVGRYESWLTPAPESLERNVERPESADRSSSVPSATRVDIARRAVIERSAALDPIEPAYAARKPTLDAIETSDPPPNVPTAAARMEVVLPLAGSAPPRVELPVAPVRVSTPSAREQVAATPRLTPAVLDVRRPAAREERATPTAVPPVAPVIRATVSREVTPRRGAETRDAMRAQVTDAPHDTPPSVVVTIGRIEVRAMPAPEPPRAVRGASPAMSLDDYLSERARGLR